jgi:hypothetical protein
MWCHIDSARAWPKAAGVVIGMSRKGCSTSRSRSAVTITSARPSGLLERSTDEDIGADNNPHPVSEGSTSCWACLISRSMSSSDQPAAITLGREKRCASVSQSFGSIVMVTS